MPSSRRSTPRLQPLFNDGFVILQSWSRDRSRVLLFAESAADAGAYYVYDTATKSCA